MVNDYRDRRDDDMDDVLASIMRGNRPEPHRNQQSPPVRPQNPPKSRRLSHSTPVATHSRPVKATIPTNAHVPAPAKTKRKRKLKKTSVALMVILPIVITASVFGVFLLKSPIADMLKPPSPFNSDLAGKMGVPLYYPTKPPKGYKIETNSITQPETDVVIYAMTDDNDHKLNISIQKQPKDIDLGTLLAVMKDPRDLDTKFGKVKVGGTPEEGSSVEIANVLTGESWVIITSDKGTITDQDLTGVINSLET